MELLNKDLKDAKTTEDLRSILLPNGEPIYDYTGGPDARVDSLSVSDSLARG